MWRSAFLNPGKPKSHWNRHPTSAPSRTESEKAAHQLLSFFARSIWRIIVCLDPQIHTAFHPTGVHLLSLWRVECQVSSSVKIQGRFPQQLRSVSFSHRNRCKAAVTNQAHAVQGVLSTFPLRLSPTFYLDPSAQIPSRSTHSARQPTVSPSPNPLGNPTNLPRYRSWPCICHSSTRHLLAPRRFTAERSRCVKRRQTDTHRPTLHRILRSSSSYRKRGKTLQKSDACSVFSHDVPRSDWRSGV